jgi:sterol desaturase/sphingolipid hydroxylase (fatty acid hydroxylase superfamily)
LADDTANWINADNIGAFLFAAVFFLVAAWETLKPARAATTSFSLRWFGNVALFLLLWATGTFLPFLTVDGAVLVARDQGWGSLNGFTWPGSVGIALSFIALDFIGYWEHRLYHSVPTLWRLHALHHSDPDLDVTTTIRHHPLEALTLLPLNAAAAIVFGFPPAAIVLYGTVVIIAQLFQHGNVELPMGLRWIGLLVMTPALHRVHHSVDYDENNSNFSNLLTIWDRLFGTLRPDARVPLRVGLTEFASIKFQRLDRMLALPWLVAPVRR